MLSYLILIKWELLDLGDDSYDNVPTFEIDTNVISFENPRTVIGDSIDIVSNSD